MKSIIKFSIFMIMISSMQDISGYIPARVQALQKSVTNNSVQNINYANSDFRGVTTLTGLDMHGIHMPNATFQPCVVTGENKKNTLMICIEKQVADLTGVNFAGANLYGVNFNQAILEKVNLSGVDFTQGSATQANFKDAIVPGMITTDATFCSAIMPDGQICSDELGVWKGQGVSIACNCQPSKNKTPTSQTKKGSK